MKAERYYLEAERPYYEHLKPFNHETTRTVFYIPPFAIRGAMDASGLLPDADH